MDAEKIAKRFSNIQVIPYSPEYKEQVANGAVQMHEDSIYRDLPLDKEKVVRQLSSSMGLVPDRYFKIAVRDGVLLGGFYGHVRKTFFCDELLAHDMGWWVLREHRNSAAAMLLLFDFEKWAKEQGAKKLMVGQSTALNIERTTKLYEHCGFKIIGYNTVKDI